MVAGILFLLSFILMLVASVWRLFVGLAVAIVLLLMVALAQACCGSGGPSGGWFYALVVSLVVFFMLGTVLSCIVYFIGAFVSLLWYRTPAAHHRGLLIMGALGIIFTALGFVATTIIPLITLSWFDYSILLPIPPVTASVLLIVAGVRTRSKAVSQANGAKGATVRRC
jgi:hypothetical protein